MTLRLAKDALLILGDEGAELRWPFSGVAVLQDEAGRHMTRLAFGDARLIVEDAAFRPALEAAAPWLAPRRALTALKLLALAGISALAVTALWWGMPRGAGVVAMAIPASFEEKLGDRVIADVGGKRCASEEGSAALERLLARIAGTTPVPYRVQIGVLDRPEVNAFAAPGGRIVVFRGLIDAATSPDEVAGVLAHELTHALKRHGTQHLVRALGLSVILDVAVGQGTARSFAETGLFLAYSRDFEREADDGAVELLHAAGIDPGPFAGFFERARKNGKGELVPLWLRSHPSDEERSGRILAASRPGSGPALDEAQWQALKRICK